MERKGGGIRNRPLGPSSTANSPNHNIHHKKFAAAAAAGQGIHYVSIQAFDSN